MCLVRKSNAVKAKYSRNRTAWKIVRRSHDTYGCVSKLIPDQYESIHMFGQYKSGKWNVANRESGLYGQKRILCSESDTYPTGFHCYLRLADAKRLNDKLPGHNNPRVVVKVRIKYPVAYGEEVAYYPSDVSDLIPVVVAKQMMVEAEVS